VSGRGKNGNKGRKKRGKKRGGGKVGDLGENGIKASHGINA
jgi:hypothetical protein